MDQSGELTPYQRGALIGYLLASGRALTTAEIMRLTGLKRSGVLKLMGQIEQLHTVAVYGEIAGGQVVWRVLAK